MPTKSVAHFVRVINYVVPQTLRSWHCFVPKLNLNNNQEGCTNQHFQLTIHPLVIKGHMSSFTPTIKAQLDQLGSTNPLTTLTRLTITKTEFGTGAQSGDTGKWVCTHSGATHTDTFVKKRKSDTHSGGWRPSPSPPPQASVATAIDHAAIARLVAAQLATQFQANMAAPTPMVTPPDILPGTQTFQGVSTEDQFMEAHEW
jgi:hypothetical protein